MKITNLTLYKVPPRWLFLKIDTDQGITGWGEPVIEGRADTVRAAVKEFRVNLIGRRRIVRDEATGKERPVFDVAKPNTEPLQQGEELVLIGTDLDLAMMMTTLGFEHDET